MKPSKQNAVFSFLFAFIPGASEMYMGFLKLGLSIMSIFVLLIMIPASIRLRDVFFLPVAVMWAYSFFHARNLAKCDEHTFAGLCDHFLWEEFDGVSHARLKLPAAGKWIAAALILFGADLLCRRLADLLYVLIPAGAGRRLPQVIDGIPSFLLAVLIIGMGIRFLAGKQPQPEEDKEQKDPIPSQEDSAP